MCLRNISKDSSVDNMKKTGLNGYVHDISVDAIDSSNIINISKNFVFDKMKKTRLEGNI